MLDGELVPVCEGVWGLTEGEGLKEGVSDRVCDCDQEEVRDQLTEEVNVLDGRDPVRVGVTEGGLSEFVDVSECDPDCEERQLTLLV